jgi:hypothetical protein
MTNTDGLAAAPVTAEAAGVVFPAHQGGGGNACLGTCRGSGYLRLHDGRAVMCTPCGKDGCAFSVPINFMGPVDPKRLPCTQGLAAVINVPGGGEKTFDLSVVVEERFKPMQ